jgi:hypothetical protein
LKVINGICTKNRIDRAEEWPKSGKKAYFGVILGPQIPRRQIYAKGPKRVFDPFLGIFDFEVT